jgi:hypothetical protein
MLSGISLVSLNTSLLKAQDVKKKNFGSKIEMDLQFSYGILGSKMTGTTKHHATTETSKVAIPSDVDGLYDALLSNMKLNYVYMGEINFSYRLFQKEKQAIFLVLPGIIFQSGRYFNNNVTFNGTFISVNEAVVIHGYSQIGIHGGIRYNRALNDKMYLNVSVTGGISTVSTFLTNVYGIQLNKNYPYRSLHSQDVERISNGDIDFGYPGNFNSSHINSYLGLQIKRWQPYILISHNRWKRYEEHAQNFNLSFTQLHVGVAFKTIKSK